MPNLLNSAPPWKGFQGDFIVLWHGCTDADRREIEANGIDLKHSRWAIDFSRGFYTTSLKRQADHWAVERSYAGEPRSPGNGPVVLRFELARHDIATLKSLHFVLADYDSDDFWSFVQHCRQSRDPKRSNKGVLHDHIGPVTEDGHRWYDTVVGPLVANWRQRSALERSDQWGFHTTVAVNLLNTAIMKRKLGRYTWAPVKL